MARWIHGIVPILLAVTIATAVSHPDPAVQKKLDRFQDQKFGLFLHWGAYSQMGCIESWPLVWADRKWSNPSIGTREEMAAFREKYFALPKTFNPAAFDPAAWASLAKKAGMRYVVFTTKHHDGFAMFDTRQSDYRITAPDVPFSKNPRANIAREVFDAFRGQGFGIGVYFSKSDWRTPYYWKPGVFAEDRNPNYDVAAEPERWAKFVEFVHGQIGELVRGYGKVDILWLDGGQVRPPKQDIQMDRLVRMARDRQPGLIVVNRASKGLYEDYRTPEQEVPEKPIFDYVWESCLTMGTQWSFKPNDTYKSSRDLIQLLARIVSRGGNLLLNIGPQPDGRLPAGAVHRLEEIGRWMQVNGEAIHGTRPVSPYFVGQTVFTAKGKDIYAIYLPNAAETRLPASIPLGDLATAGSARLLGSNEETEVRDHAIRVAAQLADRSSGQPAWVFRLDRRQ
ncbi:MAG: alpha-L-fucosidase [Bryobacteraceae bacterium]